MCLFVFVKHITLSSVLQHVFGLTLRRYSDFVRTPRQTPVMWVQASHMTGPVAARSWTLYILFIRTRGFCGQGSTRFQSKYIIQHKALKKQQQQPGYLKTSPINL